MRQVGVGGEFQSNEDSRVAAVQAECSAGAEEDTGSGSQSLEEMVEVEVEVERSLENRLGAAAGTCARLSHTMDQVNFLLTCSSPHQPGQLLISLVLHSPLLMTQPSRPRSD